MVPKRQTKTAIKFFLFSKIFKKIMKFAVIHLQTGGFNFHEHSILEFACIVEDTSKKLPFNDIPKYNVLVENEIYKGEAYAFHFNREIFHQLSLSPDRRTKPVVKYENLAQNFQIWISAYINTKVANFNSQSDINSFTEEGVSSPVFNHTILLNAAGKNFSNFHLNFIKKIPHINDYIRFTHRFMDPSILYLDVNIDEFLPGAETCKQRAGLSHSGKHTDTLLECWDTLQLFRTKLNY